MLYLMENVNAILELMGSHTDEDRAFVMKAYEFAKEAHKTKDVGAELGYDGSFNFLLGDGRHLYARCATKLCYIIRKAPFGIASLSDDDIRIDFSTVTTPKDRVAIVATTPLTTNEMWTHGQPGDLWVFKAGRLAATLCSSLGGG